MQKTTATHPLPRCAPGSDLNALRRSLLLGSLGSTILLTAGCSKPGPTQASLPHDAVILSLGDSLTFGYGAEAGASYPQRLEQLTSHPIKNAGLNGDTSEGALARLPALLQQSAPGLVLVSIGANDFLRGLPTERTRAALVQIVQTAAARAPVVLIGQPRPDRIAQGAGALEDHPVYAAVAGAGVPLFAGGWSEVLSKPELRSDEIHANAAGYGVFAERLAAWLREKNYIV